MVSYNFTTKRHISKVNIFLEFLKYLRLQLQKQITKHFATYCLSPSNFAILAPCSILNILILSPVSWNRSHISDLFPLYWLQLLLWLWISISLAQEERWGHDWHQKRLNSSLPSVSWSNLLSGILVKATAPFVDRYAHRACPHHHVKEEISHSTPLCSGTPELPGPRELHCGFPCEKHTRPSMKSRSWPSACWCSTGSG